MMAEDPPIDLTCAVDALARYAERGFTYEHLLQTGHRLMVTPDFSQLDLLKTVKSYGGKFVAVDCSTRTLKRANNWGIYLLRATHATVENREVEWGHREKATALVGPSHVRRNVLRNLRLEMESEIALSLTDKLDAADYLLLDGAGYFGEKKGFRLSLYERCKQRGLSLLSISKLSPMLHDDLGRDFQATVMLGAPDGPWVYYPVAKANPGEHLYGDISLVKLCRESPRVFRCDVMKYLTGREIVSLLSPLVTVSEDPRCLGYPVPLWLAHDLSATSDSKLLYYYGQIEDLLKKTGIYDRLSKEELACNFADELHRRRFPFEREEIDYV